MPRGGTRPTCSVDGCDGPHQARGLCSKHYQREIRNPAYQAQWRARNREHSRAYQRAWYERNKERQRELAKRRKIEERWQMPYEDYLAFIANGCAICGTTERRLCVDHDHATGAIRDPLCDRCNVAIGMLADDPGLARKAAAYLERHASSS